MSITTFFESTTCQRNKAGQGVQRDLNETDIPAAILDVLRKSKSK